jgi:hypothetical protein
MDPHADRDRTEAAARGTAADTIDTTGTVGCGGF